MPEMDYSLIHRTPDGNGKILVTTPGSPDKGSWETEAELKTYVNQDVVMDINTLNTRVTNIEETLMGENEVTVQYPNDGNYSSLMPNKVPLRALKFAEIPEFRGKTRAWDQLCDIPSSSVSYSGNGITFTDNRDGSYTLQTDANGATADTNIPIIPMNITQGKAILLGGAPKNSSETTHRLFFTSTGINTYMHGGDNVYTIVGTTTRLFLQVFAGDVVATPITFKPFIRDLNIIFQEYTTAQIVTLGMAGVLSVIPSLGQYNAYDAGSLVDTVVSGAKSVGVNIWDEEWEVGGLNVYSGANDPSNETIRSANYIPLVVGESYYVIIPANVTMNAILFYGEAKDYLGIDAAQGMTASGTLTIPPSARFMRFQMNTAYGTTYNHDIQICLNSLPDAIKTTYHPYKTDTLSLPETVTLRSAGSVAEVYDLESGEKTNTIGSANLGDYDWDFNQEGTNTYECYNSTFLKAWGTSNIICNRLETTGYADDNTYGIRGYASNGTVSVRVPKNVASSPSALKQWLADNNVVMYYPLATPIAPTQLTPVPDNFLEVEGGGTVETIQTQTPVLDNCLDVTYDIIPQ